MGFLLTIALLATSIALSLIFKPKVDRENAKPSGLGDFRFPTATEDRPIPLLWGTCQIAGPNVIWYDDLNVEKVVEKVKTGLFSSEKIVRGYRYSLGLQMALCEGPVDELTRVWIGDELVYDGTSGGPDSPVSHDGTFTIDEPDLFGGEDVGGNGGVVGTLQLKGGTLTQTASTYLSTFQSVSGSTPKYNGICYVAPSSEAVYLGNSTSIKPWKFELRRTPNGLSLSGGKEVVNDGDANIMNVLFEVFTSSRWGKGVDASDIDTTSWTTAAETLYDEGNGFSLVLDRFEDVDDMIERLEAQAEVAVFQNPSTGKWQAKLIRDDYDILTVPEVSVDTSLIEVSAWTSDTWEGTSNQVHVPVSDRADEYKDTFGTAQALANLRIAGRHSPSLIAHPGVKVPATASAIAYRDLRTLAQPLPQGRIVVDRSLYGVLPADVLGLTVSELGVTRLPVRVKSVDYGEILDGRITLEVTRDIFQARAGIFAGPAPTKWTPPVQNLSAFPADEQLAIEAPRAFTLRDPDSSSPETDKVYAAARQQAQEVAFDVRERHATPPTSPSGAYTTIGTVYQLAKIGELKSALPAGSAYPLTSLLLTATPDSQTVLEAAFPDVEDLAELGTELTTLCYVQGTTQGEFMLVEGAQTSGSDVQLDSVWRGLCGAGQADHAAGDSVFLIFLGGGISLDTIPAGDDADVLLIPRSLDGEVSEGAATAISVEMRNRTRRPYPPSSFDLNGNTLDTTLVDLDGSGSGEDVGVLFDEVVRRDHRTIDEIEAVGTDAATLFSDFPTAFSVTHSILARNAGNDLGLTSIGSGTSGTLRQLDVLQSLDEVSLPSSLEFAVRSTHTLDGTSYDSFVDAYVTSTVDSALVGKHAFGALDTNDVSNTTTAVYEVQSGDDSTDHDFTLSTAFTAGDVEYRLDGGTWTTLISSGGTTGSIPNASLSVGTDIEIRHTSSDVGAQKLLTMDVGGTVEAYSVLFT